MFGESFRFAAYLVDRRIVRCDRRRKRHEAVLTRLERAPAAERIGLVGHAAARNRLAMQAVALVVVHRCQRRVDGNFVKICTAQARDLGVDVGVNTAVQQRVVAEVDAGNDMGGAKRHLLGFRKEIVRVAVQDHASHRLHWNEFFGYQLGGIEYIEAEFIGLRLGEGLQAQLPFRIIAGFDGLPQVAPMKVRIRAPDLHRLIPDQRVRAQQRLPMELAEHRIAALIDEPERVDTESLHHAVAARNTAVGHDPEQRVRRFRHQRGEVPKGVVGRGRLRHRVVRFRLDRVNQIGEFHRILNEKYRNIVADEIPVALIGIELHGKAAHVARRVRRSALAGDRGEAHEHRRDLSRIGERRRAGQIRERLVGLEESMRPRAPRVHDALGNSFVIEMRDLLAQHEIFEQRGSPQSCLQGILIVGNRHALIRRQCLARIVYPDALQAAADRRGVERGRSGLG